MGYFIGYCTAACRIENIQEIWPIKINFDQPNAGIG